MKIYTVNNLVDAITKETCAANSAETPMCDKEITVMTNEGRYPIRQIVNLPDKVLIMLDDGSDNFKRES